MPELIFCYVPVPDSETGKSLARAALDAGLAGCANLLGPMTSIYEWEGKVQEEAEFLLILKTTAEKQRALRDWMEKKHPYECPCIAGFPVTTNRAFAEWIQRQL
ncbi:MAG: divalent-cation tolerance protein CutA [Kiritimatiellia bacterium]